jgi:hypothetical protein
MGTPDAGGTDAGRPRDAGVDAAAPADAGTDAGPVDAGCGEGSTRACTTSCGSTGLATCESGGFGTCEAPAEACNGEDDDCDGVSDDGFRAAYLRSLRAASDLDPTFGCTWPGSSVACNRAVHAYCAARGCSQSGFGPVEWGGENVDVGCVIGEVRTETFAVLATHHSSCSASAPVSPACSAAISRYCESVGLVTGFGPTAVGPGDQVRFTCVPHAIEYLVPFADLTAIQPSCGTSEIQGLHCSSAINRYCHGRGHATGFGPVEWSGSAAVILCVDP